MTRANLIEEVAHSLQITRKESEIVVESIFESMVRSLRAGDKIEIRGFGSFRVRDRRGRMGRNPKTGEQVAVQARRVPYFKPAKELRESVNRTRASASLAASAVAAVNEMESETSAQ